MIKFIKKVLAGYFFSDLATKVAAYASTRAYDRRRGRSFVVGGPIMEIHGLKYQLQISLVSDEKLHLPEDSYQTRITMKDRSGIHEEFVEPKDNTSTSN